MERLDDFIKEKCIIEDGEKISSTNFYNAYINYLNEIGDKRASSVSNRLFSLRVKKNYPEYPQKKQTSGNFFCNIITKELKESKTSSTEKKKSTKCDQEIKDKRKKYNSDYYQNNKDKLKKERKIKISIQDDLDIELSRRLGVDKKNFDRRRRNGLIEYVYEKGEVDWDNTRKKCLTLLEEFRKKHIEREMQKQCRKIKTLEQELIYYQNNKNHEDKLNSYLEYARKQGIEKLKKQNITIPDYINVCDRYHASSCPSHKSFTIFNMVDKDVNQDDESDNRIIESGTNQIDENDINNTTDNSTNKLPDFSDEPQLDMSNITKNQYINYMKWYKYKHNELEDVLQQIVNPEFQKHILMIQSRLEEKVCQVEDSYPESYLIDVEECH